MQIVEEGRIRFAFPAAWFVLKYDDCQYYRGPVSRTGAGLAAVDFVVAPLTRPASLILLEVKDFRGYAVENRARLTSGDLVTEVIKKAFDTLGALHSGLHANNAEVRGLAAVLQPYPEQVQVVLLLEEDPPPQVGASGHLSTRDAFKRDTHVRLRGDVLASLKQKLRPFRLTPAVHSCADVPAGAGWTAATQS